MFLVEDNIHVRDNLAAALEELAPLRVVDSASDEHAARAWLARGSDCDLVIVDPFLRSGCGLDVLQMARRSLPAATIVALSNETTPRVRARCVAAGAERVFDKSRDIDLLVSYCARLAQERGARSPPH